MTTNTTPFPIVDFRRFRAGAIVHFIVSQSLKEAVAFECLLEIEKSFVIIQDPPLIIRRIFIHPDLAYGEFPKPEAFSLVVIEVTLVSL